MEQAFMYGPPSLDVDYCKLFMDSLEPVKEENGGAGYSDPQLFVPSPQSMLTASTDPFHLGAPPVIKEEPVEDGFGHYFGLDNDMWSGPSESSPSDQSVSVDVMDILGSKHPDRSPQNSAMDPAAVMFYPSPTHQAVDPRAGGVAVRQQASPHQLHSPPHNQYSSPEQHKLPAPAVSSHTSAVSKRRASASPASEGGTGRQRKSKSTHNLIEKRYRNNINDKINVLRDCVPSLREAAVAEGAVADGLPQPRLNKATVLTKAAEYIQQLQQRNSALAKELSQLKAKQGAETGIPPLRSPQNEPEGMHYLEDYGRPASASSVSASSMSSASHASRTSPHFSSTTKMAATCVVGGALAMGGMLGNEDLRGLAAVPLNLPFAPSLTLGSFFKVASAVSLLFIALSLSQDRHARARKGKAARLTGSLLEHRHSAYDTACQMLEVNNVGTVSMLWSLLVVSVQIAVLWLMGESMLNAFMELSGIDVRQRRALINQAANMQLMGGSAGREPAALTKVYLFVSQALLPATPRRYMLQAMQAQELGRHSLLRPVFDAMATRLWRRAGRAAPGARESSPCPDNLAQLAACEYGDVMTVRTRKWLGMIHDGVAMPGCDDYDIVAHDMSLGSALDVLAAVAGFHAQDAAVRRYLVDGDAAAAQQQLRASAEISPAGAWVALRGEVLELVVGGAHDGERVRQAMQLAQDLVRKYPQGSKCVALGLGSIVMQHSLGAGAAASQAYGRQLARQFAADGAMLANPGSVLVVFLTLRQLAKDSDMRAMANLSDAAFVCRQWFGRNDCAGDFGLSQATRRRLIRESMSMAKLFA